MYGDEDLDFLPEDPTAFLEQLEADLDDLGSLPSPPPGPPLSREEIDELVNQTLDEELTRLAVPPPPAEPQ